MKTLHLLRHAKSSWADDRLPDQQRPLNHRGLKACRVMAQPLFAAVGAATPVIASPALRCQQTLFNIAQALDQSQPPLKWLTDPQLYTFEWQRLLDFCQRLDKDSESELLLVGHNPAFTELIGYLTGQPLANLPTCGYAKLQGPLANWQDLTRQSMTLVTLLSPKLVKHYPTDTAGFGALG